MLLYLQLPAESVKVKLQELLRLLSNIQGVS